MERERIEKVGRERIERENRKFGGVDSNFKSSSSSLGFNKVDYSTVNRDD